MRLAPGHHLHPGPDGVWRQHAPDGRVTLVNAPDALMRAFARGELPDDEELLRAFEDRGLLVRETPVEPSGVVHVVGYGPVADQVERLLEQQVKVVRGPLGGTPDMVVACAGWLPDAEWLEIDRWCLERGVPWHRCHVEGLRLFAGPCGVPYTDVRARRLAASGLPGELVAHWAYLDAGDTPPVPWPSVGGVAVVAGLIVADVLAVLSGRTVPACQYEFDPTDNEVTHHPVLSLTEPSGTALVDPRLGVITKVVREPSAVPSCVIYRAYVADTRTFAPWPADRVAGGAALADPARARAAAIGEAVERYCGNAPPKATARAAYLDLPNAVDPEEFALYSADQYAARGFPFVPMSRELVQDWISGRDLATGDPVCVPSALVLLNRRREPYTNFQMSAGIAAGRGCAAAEEAALNELYERDALTTWWMRGGPAGELRLDGPDELVSAIAGAEAQGLTVTLLRIPSDFRRLVVGVFIEDAFQHIVGFGAACRATAGEAAAKAFTEACVSYTNSIKLLDAATYETADHPYRPYRKDRAYRDDFRADWHDLTDLELNLQLYLDPRMQGPNLDRLRYPEQITLPEPLPEPRAISVDLTTPDILGTGLRVVRVVVPGLYGNAPAAFPLLGGTRLGRPVVLDPLPLA
ncbi:YcaO-like family protein [Acrocarpospora macrocephala]|uniref:YcaO-like family protein n=1 Tax=Acrocarpospora macrocephala TaxID=150177 RepID=UPI001C3F9913|nr:YcaO-like family protein [Acrocarpospora macrocephala]